MEVPFSHFGALLLDWLNARNHSEFGQAFIE